MDHFGRILNYKMIQHESFIQFHFEIIYKPGRAHTNADALSRIPYESAAAISTIAAVPELETIQRLQLEDPLFGAIINKLTDQPIAEKLSTKDRAFLRKKWPEFRIKDNLLYYYGTNALLLVLPQECRKKVFTDAHSGLTGGHFGQEKTLAKISKSYYWPTIATDVTKWTKECLACATRKSPTTRIRVPMIPIRINKPLAQVACDVLGPLPETANKNRYIVVFQCMFTKWCECFAVQDQKAATTAKLFVERFVATHGVPEKLLTDKGPNFTAELFKEICRLIGTDKLYTTPFHPAGNGQVENFNRTLANLLSFYVSKSHKDWDEHLPLVVHCYRTSEHLSTRETPFYLMFGRHARSFSDLAFSPPSQDYESIEDYRHELVRKLSFAYQVVSDNLEAARQKQKEFYDRKANFSTDKLAINDRVFLHDPSVPKGKCKKFLHKWKGPFRVLDKNATDCKIVLESGRGEPRWCHANRLKLDMGSAPLEPAIPHPPANDPLISDEAPQPPPGDEDEIEQQQQTRYPLRKRKVDYYPQ